MRLSRRFFARALPLAFGGSALVAACGSSDPRLARPVAADQPAGAPPPSPGLDPAPYPPARRDLGRRGSAKLEYANLPPGGTLTLLNLTSGPGYVSHLWCAVYCTDPLGRERARYQVYVDGETTPSVSSTLAGFHAAVSPNTDFATRFVGYNQRDALNGYYAYIPIPFRTSIRIDVVSGSDSAAATFFGIADYHLRTLDWGRMGKLHTVEQEASVPPYAWHTLLDLASPSPGVLWGTYLSLQNGDPGFGYLEGNVQMYFDGAPAPGYESSGTEDYFNNSWYFQTGVIFAEHSGCTHYDPVVHSVGAYRFHVDDPVPFERALQVRWQNGTETEATVASPTALRSHLWYYTEV